MVASVYCKRIIKLGILLCVHSVICVIIIFTHARLTIDVDLDLKENGIVFNADGTQFAAQNDNFKTDPVERSAPIVSLPDLSEEKLQILGELVPKMLEWYLSGLNTNPPLPLATMIPDKVCELFSKEATIERPVVLDALNNSKHNFTITMNETDITLATQGTLNRITPLVEAAKNWPGPMQVALHLNYDDIGNLTKVFSREDAKQHLLQRRNIVIHFIVKIGNFYPINYLRNVVLNNTYTKWILVTDIDFVPGEEVYQEAVNFLKDKNPAIEKKVYIVPAFSALVDNLTYFPRDKEQLMNLWTKTKELEETQKGMAGQKNTNYKKWATAKQPYKARWQTDFEPYIIGPTSSLPTYDEHFLQRVLDKCAQIMETSYKGFEFWVLPNAFIIHLKHERKPGQEYHAGCANRYYHKVFKIGVMKTYGRLPRRHLLQKTFHKSTNTR